MRTQLQQIAFLLLVAGATSPGTVMAQGALAPPGAPAPAMKSLQQISDQVAALRTEARTPLADPGNFVTISQPGSYYLTQNLYALVITASDVTVDLNGFSGFHIRSPSSALSDVTVANCLSGIEAGDSSLQTVAASGNRSHGVVGANNTVRGVKAANNTGAGIYCDNSTISDCTANNNGDDGIRGAGSVIANCRAFANDTTTGGYAASGIYWSGGKIQNSLADTAYPAIP